MSPGKSWTKVFSTTLLHQAELLRSLLEDNGINAVVVNKQSSPYPNLNTDFDVELFVKEENALRAKILIEKSGDEQLN